MVTPSSMPTTTSRYLSSWILSTNVSLTSITTFLVCTISSKFSTAPLPCSLCTQRQPCFWLFSVEHGTAVEEKEKEEFGDNNLCKDVNRRKLYVANLLWGYSTPDLKSLFDQFGHANDVEIIKQKNGKSRGFGFVVMSSPEDVQVVIDKLDCF